jgi:hypothetical protein
LFFSTLIRDESCYDFVLTMFRRSLLVVVLVVCGSGCDRSRLAEFREFASAGSAYATAALSLLDQAGLAAIDADSVVLVTSRHETVLALREIDHDANSKAWQDEAASKERTVIRNDQNLREYLTTLRVVGDHTRLLARYFGSIAALGETKGNADILAATQGLWQSLSATSDQVRNARISGTPVSQFLEGPVTAVLDHVRVRALSRELRDRASALERALAVETAAMRAISNQLRVDTNAVLTARETREVILPYRTLAEDLPSTWSSRRAEILRSSVPVPGSTAAENGARALHDAFTRLLANELRREDIPGILADANAITSYATLFTKEAQ